MVIGIVRKSFLCDFIFYLCWFIIKFSTLKEKENIKKYKIGSIILGIITFCKIINL